MVDWRRFKIGVVVIAASYVALAIHFDSILLVVLGGGLVFSLVSLARRIDRRGGH